VRGNLLLERKRKKNTSSEKNEEERGRSLLRFIYLKGGGMTLGRLRARKLKKLLGRELKEKGQKTKKKKKKKKKKNTQQRKRR